MRNLSLLFILVFLCSCTSEEKKAENIKLVENYVLAVENLDYTAMESMLSDDYVGIGPSYGDSINKEQAVTSWKHNVENLYESIDYDRSRNLAVIVPDGVNKGEWVANWAELSIVYKNGNKKVKIWVNSNYLIENGKIKRSITFYNEADVLEQLGYVFINPSNL